VWDRAAMSWLADIAPHFLAAWDRAARGEPVGAQPDVEALLSERASSGGSSPGGPK
jgi:hypothetical protein